MGIISFDITAPPDVVLFSYIRGCFVYCPFYWAWASYFLSPAKESNQRTPPETKASGNRRSAACGRISEAISRKCPDWRPQSGRESAGTTVYILSASRTLGSCYNMYHTFVKFYKGALNVVSSLRRTEADTTFRPRPTETPLVDRKGFQNLGFGFWVLFPCGKSSPRRRQDKPIRPPIHRQGVLRRYPRLVAVFGVLLTPRVPVAADRIVAAAAV